MWKQIKYFLMSRYTCLETLVKAAWPLSQRPPENCDDQGGRQVPFTSAYYRMNSNLDLLACHIFLIDIG